jgi:hypothetical protein
MNDANTNTTPSTNTTTTGYTNADPTTTDPNTILTTLFTTRPKFAIAFANLIQQHTPPILINPTPTNAPPPLPTNLPTTSVLFHQPPTSTNPWLTTGHHGTTIWPNPNPPSVPTTTTTPFNPHSPYASTIGKLNEDDGDELPYSQSDFLPTTQPTSNTQTDITAFIDMTNNNTTDVGQNGNQHVMRKTDRRPRRNLGMAKTCGSDVASRSSQEGEA